jgi:hypothetical protein
MQQLVRMFPDIRVHTPYPSQFGGGDSITVVTNATGTFTGKMTLPDGKRRRASLTMGLSFVGEVGCASARAVSESESARDAPEQRRATLPRLLDWTGADRDA